MEILQTGDKIEFAHSCYSAFGIVLEVTKDYIIANMCERGCGINFYQETISLPIPVNENDLRYMKKISEELFEMYRKEEIETDKTWKKYRMAYIISNYMMKLRAKLKIPGSDSDVVNIIAEHCELSYEDVKTIYDEVILKSTAEHCEKLAAQGFPFATDEDLDKIFKN